MDKATRMSLCRIKAVATDVDGVLTDGGMYYSDKGEELKRFSTRDGMALQRLRDAGIVCAFITGEDSRIVRARAEKLRIKDVYLGCSDKSAAGRDLCRKYGISMSELLYVGDDVNDMGLLSIAGVSVCPADAARPVLAVADIRTVCPGGQGVLREVAEELLACRKSL
jgi:YrbI family 3-deoxy-D-manno-octulosonate 8-phosphate phosphatase